MKIFKSICQAKVKSYQIKKVLYEIYKDFGDNLPGDALATAKAIMDHDEMNVFFSDIRYHYKDHLNLLRLDLQDFPKCSNADKNVVHFVTTGMWKRNQAQITHSHIVTRKCSISNATVTYRTYQAHFLAGNDFDRPDRHSMREMDFIIIWDILCQSECMSHNR